MATDTIITYEASSEYIQNEGRPEIKLKIATSNSMYIIHSALVKQLARKKQGTAHSKTRSKVRGGSRKPWKQKGTGRARAGSNRSPLWKGGGVIFGPKPRITKIKLNQKERQLALKTLLYNKRNSISVVEDLENIIEVPKTNTFCTICKNCGVSLEKKLLIIVSKKTKALKLATRNIKNVEIILASNLNTLSVLKTEQILLTPQAISDIKEIYCD